LTRGTTWGIKANLACLPFSKESRKKHHRSPNVVFPGTSFVIAREGLFKLQPLQIVAPKQRKCVELTVIALELLLEMPD
jgi:hypothetical protein